MLHHLPGVVLSVADHVGDYVAQEVGAAILVLHFPALQHLVEKSLAY